MQVQSEQVLENELLNQLFTQYTRIKLKDMDEFELHPKSWTEKTTFGGAVFL